METEIKKKTHLVKQSLLAIQFNMNHSRGDLLYNICNEIVLVSQAVGVIMES